MPENAFRRFYWAESIKTQQTQPLWEYKQHYSFYNTPPSSQNIGPPKAPGSPKSIFNLILFTPSPKNISLPLMLNTSKSTA